MGKKEMNEQFDGIITGTVVRDDSPVTLVNNGVGIYAKLLEVRKDVGYIQKDAKNDFQKYKYVSAANVQDKLGDSLNKHGVATFSNATLVSESQKPNSKGGIETHCIVSMQVTFVDTENGQAVVVNGLGSGQDNGDKAVMKASTAAIKYALMTTFLISTGDDPEADKSVDERNSTEVKEMLEASHNNIELCKEVISEYGYKKSLDVLESDYEPIMITITGRLVAMEG
jgi:hypothetical protein